MALTILSLVLVALVGFVVPRWLNARANHMSCAAHHTEALGKAAAELIEHPDVPDVVADFVASLVTHAHNPVLARTLARDIWSGAFDRRPPRATDLSRAIQKLDGKCLELFASVLGNAVMASAHADLLRATHYQRLLQWGLSKENPAKFESPARAKAVAIELSQHEAFSPQLAPA